MFFQQSSSTHTSFSAETVHFDPPEPGSVPSAVTWSTHNTNALPIQMKSAEEPVKSSKERLKAALKTKRNARKKKKH